MVREKSNLAVFGNGIPKWPNQELSDLKSIYRHAPTSTCQCESMVYT